MPPALVEIRQENRSTGDQQPEPPVLLELLFEHKTSVRELIRRTVQEEVNTRLRENRRALQGKLSLLSQRALTEKDIAEQAAKGKIGMPSQTSVRRQMKRSAIDLKYQVPRAWAAFEARDFLLTVDGNLMEALDQTVNIGLNTKIVFTRTAAFLWLSLK